MHRHIDVTNWVSAIYGKTTKRKHHGGNNSTTIRVDYVLSIGLEKRYDNNTTRVDPYTL
jgi:hypothetical protein